MVMRTYLANLPMWEVRLRQPQGWVVHVGLVTAFTRVCTHLDDMTLR